jgi:hypothetical protein
MKRREDLRDPESGQLIARIEFDDDVAPAPDEPVIELSVDDDRTRYRITIFATRRRPSPDVDSSAASPRVRLPPACRRAYSL